MADWLRRGEGDWENTKKRRNNKPLSKGPSFDLTLRKKGRTSTTELKFRGPPHLPLPGQKEKKSRNTQKKKNIRPVFELRGRCGQPKEENPLRTPTPMPGWQMERNERRFTTTEPFGLKKNTVLILPEEKKEISSISVYSRRGALEALEIDSA